MQFINSEYCFFFIIIIYIVKQNMNILQLTCFIQMHIHLNINHQNINKIIIFQCTDEKRILVLGSVYCVCVGTASISPLIPAYVVRECLLILYTGIRIANILHARLRQKCGSLKCDLFRCIFSMPISKPKLLMPRNSCILCSVYILHLKKKWSTDSM
jgi:hypothetical protein